MVHRTNIQHTARTGMSIGGIFAMMNGFCTWPRFRKEAKSNSETGYLKSREGDKVALQNAMGYIILK